MSEVLRLNCRKNLLTGLSPVRPRALLVKQRQGFLTAAKYV